MNNATDTRGGLEAAEQASGAAGVDSIQAVRQLLVGQQLEDIESRFAELEQRLFARLASIQASITQRIETIEKNSAVGIKAAEDRIAREHMERKDDVEGMQGRVASLDSKLNKSSDELTDAIGKVVKEFQDQLFSQHKYVGKELEETRAYILSMVDTKLESLEEDAVNRGQLGLLLGDLAHSISAGAASATPKSQDEKAASEAAAAAALTSADVIEAVKQAAEGNQNGSSNGIGSPASEEAKEAKGGNDKTESKEDKSDANKDEATPDQPFSKVSDSESGEAAKAS